MTAEETEFLRLSLLTEPSPEGRAGLVDDIARLPDRVASRRILEEALIAIHAEERLDQAAWRERAWKVLIEELWTIAEASSFFAEVLASVDHEPTCADVARKLGRHYLGHPDGVAMLVNYIRDPRTPEGNGFNAVGFLARPRREETTKIAAIRELAFSAPRASRTRALDDWLDREATRVELENSRLHRCHSGLSKINIDLRRAVYSYCAEIEVPLNRLTLKHLRYLGLVPTLRQAAAREDAHPELGPLAGTASELEYVLDASIVLPETTRYLLALAGDTARSADSQRVAIRLLALHHTSRADVAALLEQRLRSPYADDRSQAFQWWLVCHHDNREQVQVALDALNRESETAVLTKMLGIALAGDWVDRSNIEYGRDERVRSGAILNYQFRNKVVQAMLDHPELPGTLETCLRTRSSDRERHKLSAAMFAHFDYLRTSAHKRVERWVWSQAGQVVAEGWEVTSVRPTEAEAEATLRLLRDLEERLRYVVGNDARLITPELVLAAPRDRIVAMLFNGRRRTDDPEYALICTHVAARPDREAIRETLEEALKREPLKNLRGQRIAYNAGDGANGRRWYAWNILLNRFWSKAQAIAFALAQIAAANRPGANRYEQELLEETQVEAIAQLSRHYKGDCDVAAALASVSALPYSMERLRGHLIGYFARCAGIVPPLAAHLPEEDSAIDAAWLIQGIGAHLAVYPELWDLVEATAFRHLSGFRAETLRPLVNALGEHPRTVPLLRSIASRLPRDGSSAYDDRDLLRLYMAHDGHKRDETALCRRVATEGADVLACEALHWLARYYHGHDQTPPTLIERLRAAREIKVRVCAFHCLLLYFGDRPEIAFLLATQAEQDVSGLARDKMRGAFDGRQPHQIFDSFASMETYGSYKERQLFELQSERIRGHFVRVQ